MKKTFSFFYVAGSSALLFLLAACATEPRVDPQVTAAVSAHQVSLQTYHKMLRGGALDYKDIAELVQRGVPSNIVVGYLRSTESVYNFSYQQLQQLHRLGATPQVLNYLTETQGFYGNNRPPPKQGSQVPKYIRAHSMLNQDKQPFFYNEPIVDDWYDSAYEESCYSPFSFN